jgi:hypothetical protein
MVTAQLCSVRFASEWKRACNCGDAESAMAKTNAPINPMVITIRFICGASFSPSRDRRKKFLNDRQLAHVSGVDRNCLRPTHVLHDNGLSVSGDDGQLHSARENGFAVRDLYFDGLHEGDELRESRRTWRNGRR